MQPELPLVYSCSGCSSAAQMANSIALRLDREGRAEMSCIAGVGGGVQPLVRTAKSGRPIIALDGCALKCVAHCLARHGVVAERHFVLSGFGVEKKKQHLFSAEEIEGVYTRLLSEIDEKPAAV
ncbi:putative zinc-binding protein [Turneriella parva]|uniref:DGC domain protein n=1 Tax=Turneriella parva (strain ATCC BAA-1111 / DSM 21527 / NCTC 11395 / H) TaxID=869212 RepID=I4B640_TURPD|nr:putative zinc-binding protein [Turneriella parva]AFM12747.1 DGC domain protein [Turneriella parva DSM 21527]